jgi:hypothetical protein
VAKRRTPYAPSRLAPVFREYIKKHVPRGSQKAVGAAVGMAGNTLSEQSTGSRPASLETVEKVAAYAKQSGKDLMIDLLACAVALDTSEPGWDKPRRLDVDVLRASEVVRLAGQVLPKSVVAQPSRGHATRGRRPQK